MTTEALHRRPMTACDDISAAAVAGTSHTRIRRRTRLSDDDRAATTRRGFIGSSSGTSVIAIG
jgi:hypothetical protein